MRITKGQLRRIIREEVNRVNRAGRTRRLREAAGPNYKAAHFNMDEWMQDDPQAMDDFEWALENINGSVEEDMGAEEVKEFLYDTIQQGASEERFYDIAGEDASFEGFVDWLLSRYN